MGLSWKKRVMISKKCDACTRVFQNKMDSHKKTLINPDSKQVNKFTHTMPKPVIKYKCLRDHVKNLKKPKKS